MLVDRVPIDYRQVGTYQVVAAKDHHTAHSDQWDADHQSPPVARSHSCHRCRPSGAVDGNLVTLLLWLYMWRSGCEGHTPQVSSPLKTHFLVVPQPVRKSCILDG